MTSVRKHEKLPPCQTESDPHMSKMDLLLAKAKLIRKVIIHLRKFKKGCTAAVREKREKM